jgi:hypothetical protein
MILLRFEVDIMVWNCKEFDKHKHEWKYKITMSEKEVLTYLNIKKEQLYKLIKLGWIGKYLYLNKNWKGHRRYVYDRYEIIAFAHDKGLRT